MINTVPMPNMQADDLQRDGFRLIQRKDGYRFGQDTVLLAAYTYLHRPKKRAPRIADLGCNGGALSFLYAARDNDAYIDGFERVCDACALFDKNIAINKTSARMRVIQTDIRDIKRPYHQSYDMVMSNPPYRKPTDGPLPSRTSDRAAACVELFGGINDFARCAADLLVSKGYAFFVYPANRLPELIEALHAACLMPYRARFVYPREDKHASIVLMCARKNVLSGSFCIEKPLLLYQNNNKPSEELVLMYET